MTMVRSSRFSWFAVTLAAVALGAAWRVHSGGDPVPLGAAVVPDELPHPHEHDATAAGALRRLELAASAEHADDRYHARVVEGAAVALNPEQRFGVRVTSRGAQVAADDGGFEVTLSLVSVGREGAEVALDGDAPATDGNRVELARGDVLEWYLNGPLGLEQGFELTASPAGEGPLQFALDVDGLTPALHEDRVALLDAQGMVRAHYSDLFALDAEGDELPARMRLVDGRIALEVDDRGAQYPIVVDPLVSTQEARLSPATPRTGRHGSSVATNNNIHGLWAVVGAPEDDRAGQDAGAAYLYRRNAAGTGWDAIATFAEAGAGPGAHFGASVAVGYFTPTEIRILVGAPGVVGGGRVYVYTFTVSTLTVANSSTRTSQTPATGDEFGASIAVNSTVGISTFVVGAPGANGGAGAAFAFRSGSYEATLSALDAGAGDRFGAAMAPYYTDPDGLLIGAPNDDAGATADAGSVYHFLRGSGTPVVWTQQAKLAHGSPATNARFGAAMVRVANGQWLVGEPGRTNGAVHRATVQAGGLVLSSTTTAADGAAGDGFGSSLAFLEAGTNDHVLVGAPGVDTAALLTGQGALYRYSLSSAFAMSFLERTTGTAPGHAAGTSCAMPSATLVLFGVPGDDTYGSDAGLVRSQSTSPSGFEAPLTPDSVSGDRFGSAVAIDGDTAAVASPYDDTVGPNAGAITIFTRSGTTWSTQARIEIPGHQLVGGALALEGDVLAIGSQAGGANTVYVTRRTGSSWSAPVALAPVGVVVGDGFGTSVSLRQGTLAVGAPGTNGAGSDRGAVYVFVDQAGSFAQQAVITAGNGNDADLFGYAVAVDGNLLVVGAPGRDGGGGATDIGLAYVYTRNGSLWTQQAILAGPSTMGSAFGRAVALRGTRAAVGAPAVPVGGVATGAGTVRTFTRGSATWTMESNFLLAGGVLGDEFGAALALSGDTLMVGAPGRDNGGLTDVGVVVPHHRAGGAWVANAVLAAPTSDDSNADAFGRAVAADGRTVLVGAPLSDVDTSDAGAAYVFSVLRGLGEACDANDQCSSTVCVDGVCCSSSCGGGAANDCMACSVAAGGTTDGTCTALSTAAAPTVTCRAASPSNACDVAETCVAGNTACPANGFAVNGTPCGSAPSGVCDAQDVCNAGSCMAVYASNSTVCRPSSGECDAPEMCTGSSASCPANNTSALNGMPCGGAPSGLCDAQDVCMTNTCMAVFAGAGTVCRASNGECDAAEQCTGSSAACPADNVNALNGQPCGGPPSGLCDAQDVCAAGSCSSVYAAGGTVCRASTGGCDTAEVCSGSAASCPADVNGCCMNDAACDDGNVCTMDSCNLQSGVCSAGPMMAGCCVEDRDCPRSTVCSTSSCNQLTHQCETVDAGPDCCEQPADCDDGDACTIDDCSANVCVHAADPVCNTMDAGVGGMDAGVAGMDAGMMDGDAGVPMDDAGTTTDAGADQGAGDDAGPDAADPDAGPMTGDMGPDVDAGPPPSANGGGCGCTVRDDESSSPVGALLVLVAGLVVGRLRRRRAHG